MSSGEVSYLMPKKETMYKSSLPAFLKGPIIICKKDGKGPALGDLILSKTEQTSMSTNSDTIDYSTKAEHSLKSESGKALESKSSYSYVTLSSPEKAEVHIRTAQTNPQVIKAKALNKSGHQFKYIINFLLPSFYFSIVLETTLKVLHFPLSRKVVIF